MPSPWQLGALATAPANSRRCSPLPWPAFPGLSAVRFSYKTSLSALALLLRFGQAENAPYILLFHPHMIPGSCPRTGKTMW